MDTSIVQIVVILTVLPLICSQSENQRLVDLFRQWLAGYSSGTLPVSTRGRKAPGPPGAPFIVSPRGNRNGNGENGENGNGENGNRRRNCLPGGSIVCGPNADCVGRRRNICQCKDGYRGGDPYDTIIGCYCTQQCGTNAHCEGRICKCDPDFVGNPYNECFPGNCGGRSCGANAKCINDVCVCEPGSTGDPYLGCTAACGAGTCGHNAHCDSGTCVCNPGYFGEFPATWGCAGPCRDQFCGYNATCVNDFCTCNYLHQGNGYWPSGCSVPESRQCGSQICGWNAVCVEKVNAICECVQDYHNYVPDPDPYTRCKATNNCWQTPCGPNEYCVENYSTCVCNSGYSRDAVTNECTPGCFGAECGPKQYCSSGTKKCECIKNYEFDQAEERCVYSPDLCGDVYCGPLAECDRQSNVCKCLREYIGDPNIGCSLPSTL